MLRIQIYIGLVLECIGLFLFCKGFFPVKDAVLTGFAERSASDARPIFDSLVFVVIDALRSDLAYGPSSNMTNLHHYINEGVAVPFTARAATPTVTLPRLKCLTTGAITGFLDAILNIAESSESSDVSAQDNWVQQSVLAGRKLHMYGDDTWARLFPTAFSKIDGTSSFLVSDFTEVDNNVTRHLDHELLHPNWDVLILHYLGLDHIGHLEGPASRHMPIKQAEMDNIIERIFRGLLGSDSDLDKKTLMIVLGDHGMTGDGNHGGASEAETHTALTFISPMFATRSEVQKAVWPDIGVDRSTLHFYDSMLQSDLVPSLSLMLGLPIPKNSLGIIPESLLSMWNTTDAMSVLLQNAAQLQRLFLAGKSAPMSVNSALLCSTEAAAGGCLLSDIDFGDLVSLDPHENAAVKVEIYRLLRVMQDSLMIATSDYKMHSMYLGLSFLALALLVILGECLRQPFASSNLVIYSMPVLHSATAFASSFIEEEQAFWYYIGALGMLYIAFKLSLMHVHNAPWLAISGPLLFRILRRYHQTGQKYSGASDICSSLARYPKWELFSFILGACDLMAGFSHEPHKAWEHITIAGAGVVLTLIKVPNSIVAPNATYLVGLIWILVTLTLLYTLTRPSIERSRGYSLAMAFVFLLQSKTQNAIVLVVFRAIDHVLQRQTDSAWVVPMYIVMQQASFFFLGNSNSISGIDLSQAYNGVLSYNPALVGALLFISAFIGPIFWQVSLANWIRKHPEQGRAKQFAGMYMTLCSCMYATALCVSCYTLRHHLFVFSVFSPKLLFTLAWTLFYGLSIISL